MDISICISTYKRPELLGRLLAALAGQKTAGLFTYSVTVADNDSLESARSVVAGCARDYPIPLSYHVESRRSIAHVRNMTISQSTGELIAFIDDDEYPADDWLLNLFSALTDHECAGVLAAVRPSYLEGTPLWVKKSGLFDRPEHETGFVMPWTECRTGNVLFRRKIIEGVSGPFSADFGTGGSDVDFFRRMIAAGHRFIWCNTAPVYEYVLPSRWNRKVLVNRALLRGRNAARHPEGLAKCVVKALVAIPLYLIALPFLQLRGHQYFMLYLIKTCDHFGLLLAVVGIDLVKQRPM